MSDGLQLLVCVKKFFGVFAVGEGDAGTPVPQVGHVYTFDGFGKDGYYQLKELNYLTNRGGRACYDPSKLRPLSEVGQELTQELVNILFVNCKLFKTK